MRKSSAPDLAAGLPCACSSPATTGGFRFAGFGAERARGLPKQRRLVLQALRAELFAGSGAIMRQPKFQLTLPPRMPWEQYEASQKIRDKAKRGHRRREYPFEERLSAHLILAAHEVGEAMRQYM